MLPLPALGGHLPEALLAESNGREERQVGDALALTELQVGSGGRGGGREEERGLRLLTPEPLCR